MAVEKRTFRISGNVFAVVVLAAMVFAALPGYLQTG
jgi:hypothetical protein